MLRGRVTAAPLLPNFPSGIFPTRRQPFDLRRRVGGGAARTAGDADPTDALVASISDLGQERARWPRSTAEASAASMGLEERTSDTRQLRIGGCLVARFTPLHRLPADRG